MLSARPRCFSEHLLPSRGDQAINPAHGAWHDRLFRPVPQQGSLLRQSRQHSMQVEGLREERDGLLEATWYNHTPSYQAYERHSAAADLCETALSSGRSCDDHTPLHQTDTGRSAAADLCETALRSRRLCDDNTPIHQTNTGLSAAADLCETALSSDRRFDAATPAAGSHLRRHGRRY